MKYTITNGKLLLIPQNQWDKKNLKKRQKEWEDQVNKVNISEALDRLKKEQEDMDIGDLEKHVCEKMQETNDVKAGGFNGQSVEVIYKTPDGWVATQIHYEYGTYIKFCPFCGLKLD